jgi:hypothetical protein
VSVEIRKRRKIELRLERGNRRFDTTAYERMVTTAA